MPGDRPVKPIKLPNNTLPKRNPVEGMGGGRGGAVSPTYFFILSLEVIRFHDLFPNVIVVLRVCAFVFVLLVRNRICDDILVTCEYHVNERCHRANQCFSSVFFMG